MNASKSELRALAEQACASHPVTRIVKRHPTSIVGSFKYRGVVHVSRATHVIRHLDAMPDLTGNAYRQACAGARVGEQRLIKR